MTLRLAVPTHSSLPHLPSRRVLRRATLSAAALLGATAFGAAVFSQAGCNANRKFSDDEPQMEDPNPSNPNMPNKPGMIVVSPNPIALVADGSEQRIKVTAFSTSYGDITKKATWSLSDPSIGSVQNGELVVRGLLDRGGKSLLYANYGIQTGTATINIKLIAPDVVDTSAPPNAKDYFGGGSGGSKPSWIYPIDKTLLPRNLVEVNLQWQGVSGAQVYRVSIDSPTYARSFYVGPGACPGNQCRFMPSDADWTALARSSAGTDTTFTVSASPGMGQPVGSTDLGVGFSPEDVKGGLYYWSTTITGLYRVPLGAKSATVFINRGNEFGCAGCHSVSRDGKKVALEFGSANGTGGGVVDGTDGTKYIIRPPSAQQWNLQSFSPKGDMLIVNWQQRARIIDANTGVKLFDVPEKMAQPEWSPDGLSIVYVRYPADGSGDEWMASNTGDIMIIPFNGGAFGAPQLILESQPNKEYHFYPSWTPDSKWIIFNTGKAPCGGFGGSGCNTYDPANTVLRLIKAAPGNKPIELVRAGYRMGSSTNWPRVAPFVQNGKLIFFTFSAKFPYGFIKTGTNPQIWMAGVDLDVATNKPDEDPSFAPFWLPFQKVNESNHLGTWTTDVVCMDNSQCPSEFQCMMGSCVPRIG